MSQPSPRGRSRTIGDVPDPAAPRTLGPARTGPGSASGVSRGRSSWSGVRPLCDDCREMSAATTPTPYAPREGLPRLPGLDPRRRRVGHRPASRRARRSWVRAPSAAGAARWLRRGALRGLRAPAAAATPGSTTAHPGLASATRGGRRPGRLRRLGDVGPALALAALGLGAVLALQATLGGGALFWPAFFGAGRSRAAVARRPTRRSASAGSTRSGRIDPVRIVFGSGGWASYARVAAGALLVVLGLSSTRRVRGRVRRSDARAGLLAGGLVLIGIAHRRSARGSSAWPPTSAPSARSGCARRSGPTSPPTCTTRCCRPSP